MKKFYMFTVAFVLCSIAITNAQTRTWVGPSGGNWNTAANWSPVGVPNANTFNVVFNANALVNVDIATFTLNSITVTGSATAKLYTSANTTITLNSGTIGSEGLRIETGSRLEDSCATNVSFRVVFASAARGVINGTWYFAGHSSVSAALGATFDLPSTSGQGTRVDVNGSMILATKSGIPDLLFGNEYLFFNTGSLYWLDRDGGATPLATWHANSTVRVTGVTNVCPVISIPSTLGNLVFDCAGIVPTNIGWSLPNHLVIGGNFQILNTNNKNLTLAQTIGGPVTVIDYTVNGNLEVSGTSNVILGNSGGDKDYSIQVNGNYTQTGGSFLLRAATVVAATLPTALKVKGVFNQSGGTFGNGSPVVSTSTELFVVELNGTSNQNVSSSTGTIDNAQNMVTLRLNNTAGATLLTPLSVGKISWNSANKGKLTTTAVNLLTINNTNAADATVINGFANTGYVNGPVKRLTLSTAEYRFPVGKGLSDIRFCDVTPGVATASSYTAEYFNTAHASSAVLTPLVGVSNVEYWEVSQVTGTNGKVRLHLAGQVPGTNSGHGLVVARFNSGSSQWVSERGTTGTALIPGNVSSGTVISGEMASFSPFTFGYAPASALPVYLVSFNGKKGSGNTARLNWTVTSNSDADRFDVLRSTDGAQFSSIGTVTAVDHQLNYEFQDNNLPQKTTYYRLRMIDKNGAPALSKIIAVINGGEGILITSMMPTIVTDQAKLNISSAQKGNIRLSVTDMYGRIVKQQAASLVAGSQDVWLNLASLPAGAYQVTGYLERGDKTASIRFVKR